MIRFAELERLGVAVAAMSDRSDGDCRAHDPSGEPGRQAFCTALGIDCAKVTVGKQVHGTRVVIVAAGDRGRGSAIGHAPFAETDALITGEVGLPIAVTVADCVPILLFDPVTEVIGVAHAGRAGTVQGIARCTVEAMAASFGTNPADVHAVIGPSAGPTSYEVSEELAREFLEAGLPTRGRLLDLWEANAGQLVKAGVPRGQITVSGICTITDGRFHSHRAHANGMRNMAILMR
ncbi:MAG: laccase domain-containing protein [Candidatus Hydrogenedentes bacterium]|nr:laccase domain-containing protein [Candidatus Hydrogenedentota bacterium]